MTTEQEVPGRATVGQRWLARLAFAPAAAAVVVLVLAGALRSVTALLAGLAGLAITCAAAWWFLTHRGPLRWLALALLVAAPVFTLRLMHIASVPAEPIYMRWIGALLPWAARTSSTMRS